MCAVTEHLNETVHSPILTRDVADRIFGGGGDALAAFETENTGGADICANGVSGPPRAIPQTGYAESFNLTCTDRGKASFELVNATETFRVVIENCSKYSNLGARARHGHLRVFWRTRPSFRAGFPNRSQAVA